VAQIISWNVTTLRSLVNKNPSLLTKLFKQERPDVVFLQETKLNEAEHAEYEGKIAEVTIGTRRPGGISRSTKLGSP
jgi:exonuclease III